MCLVKTPKIDPLTNKVPEPTIIRNNYLDGIDPATKSLRKGRSSLRIERAGSGATRVAPPASGLAPLPNSISTVAPLASSGSPVLGGGGSFGNYSNLGYINPIF